MSSRRATILLFAAALAVLVPATAFAGHNEFRDGPFGAHDSGVHWLVDAGVTSGCDAGHYCPSDPVTRAQMATFMHRLSGNSETPPSVNAGTVSGRTATQLQAVGGHEIASDFEPFSTAVVDMRVTCPGGKKALGGGGGAYSSFETPYLQLHSIPTEEGNGWWVAYRSVDGDAHAGDVYAFVICADAEASAATASVDSSMMSRVSNEFEQLHIELDTRDPVSRR